MFDIFNNLSPFGELILFGTVAVFLLGLGSLNQIRRMHRLAKTVGGYCRSALLGLIRVNSNDSICDIVISGGDKYTSPNVTLTSRIEPSFRARVGLNNVTYMDFMPLLPIQSDMRLLGTVHRIATDDQETNELLKRCLVSFDIKLRKLPMFEERSRKFTLRIEPERTFWMRKRPTGSKVIMAYLPYELSEDPTAMKHVFDAFISLLADLSTASAE